MAGRAGALGGQAVSIDWQGMLYDRNYEILGTSAALTPGSGGAAKTVTAIDKTSGLEVNDASQPGLLTVKPAAMIRMSDLTANGLTRDDLDDGTIVLDGKTWRIKSHLLKPGPEGELRGEVVLFLLDEDT